MRNLIDPVPSVVQWYVEAFEKEQSVVEMALAKVFDLFPTNKSLDEVLIKVVTLNSLYVTNIYATWTVAEHIVKSQIDGRLGERELSVVSDIATVMIKGKSRRNYSFASKYCAWHAPAVYPIYDRFVDNLLWAYQKQRRFSSFGRYDLWNNYEQFVNTIRDFQVHYSLQDFSLKQLDNFLWLYGKDYEAGRPPAVSVG